MFFKNLEVEQKQSSSHSHFRTPWRLVSWSERAQCGWHHGALMFVYVTKLRPSRRWGPEVLAGPELAHRSAPARTGSADLTTFTGFPMRLLVLGGPLMSSAGASSASEPDGLYVGRERPLEATAWTPPVTRLLTPVFINFDSAGIKGSLQTETLNEMKLFICP